MGVKSKNNILLFVFVLVVVKWLPASGENVTKVEKDKQYTASTPVSVDSRFFDLGQLFQPLLSNFNQNRPAGNVGTNLPQNSEFSPGAQGNFPQNQSPGIGWGNQNQNNFRPPQNQGFNFPPNGQNQWQSPQFSNQGGSPRPNYPDESNNYPMQRPNQFPGNNQNPSYWRPEYNGQRPMINSGSNGLQTQIQVPTNQGQYWNQPKPIPNPDQNNMGQFPTQGYQRPPNNGNENYPYNNNQQNGNGAQDQNFNQGDPGSPVEYPNQGNLQSPGVSGSGTLDDLSPQINNDAGNNAILGKPVIVPTTTVNPDQIVFDNSSESPLQTQCVQDCPATPEYNPICGTNNVTYFNPGKFVCARNCGVSVYVVRRGVCSRRPM